MYARRRFASVLVAHSCLDFNARCLGVPSSVDFTRGFFALSLSVLPHARLGSFERGEKERRQPGGGFGASPEDKAFPVSLKRVQGSRCPLPMGAFSSAAGDIGASRCFAVVALAF